MTTYRISQLAEPAGVPATTLRTAPAAPVACSLDGPAYADRLFDEDGPC